MGALISKCNTYTTTSIIAISILLLLLLLICTLLLQYNTIQYNTIQYNTIQYNTIQYNTIQYNTIQYNKTLLSLKGNSFAELIKYINKTVEKIHIPLLLILLPLLLSRGTTVTTTTATTSTTSTTTTSQLLYHDRNIRPPNLHISITICCLATRSAMPQKRMGLFQKAGAYFIDILASNIFLYDKNIRSN